MAKRVGRKFMGGGGLLEGVVVNVNIPYLSVEKTKGFIITRQGLRVYRDAPGSTRRSAWAARTIGLAANTNRRERRRHRCRRAGFRICIDHAFAARPDQLQGNGNFEELGMGDEMTQETVQSILARNSFRPFQTIRLITQSTYIAEGWGDSPQMADELGELIVQGTKTATCSALWEWEAEGNPIPKTGLSHHRA